MLLAVLVALLAWGCQALTGGDQGQQDQQDSQQQGSQQGGQGSGEDVSGESASGGETTATGGSSEQDQEQISAQLASISTQNVDGSAVTVPETSISGTEGWVAVYGEEFGGGQPTPELVGYAPIQEGQNANVEVFPWRGP